MSVGLRIGGWSGSGIGNGGHHARRGCRCGSGGRGLRRCRAFILACRTRLTLGRRAILLCRRTWRTRALVLRLGLLLLRLWRLRFVARRLGHLHLLLCLCAILRALGVGRLTTLVTAFLVGAVAVAAIATLLVATVAAVAGIAAIAALTATLAALATVIAAGIVLARTRGRLRGRGNRFDAAEDPLQPAHHASDRCRNGHGHHRHRSSDGRDRGRGFFAHRCRLARLDRRDRRSGRNVQLRLGQCMHRKLARGASLVARLAALFAQLVLAQARDFVVRGVQLLVGDDDDRRLMALLDFTQRTTLFVEQVIGDFHRRLDQHLPGVFLHGVFFGHADDRQRQRLDAAHAAMAVATRADDLAGFAQART